MDITFKSGWLSAACCPILIDFQEIMESFIGSSGLNLECYYIFECGSQILYHFDRMLRQCFKFFSIFKAGLMETIPNTGSNLYNCFLIGSFLHSSVPVPLLPDMENLQCFLMLIVLSKKVCSAPSDVFHHIGSVAFPFTTSGISSFWQQRGSGQEKLDFFKYR